MSAFHLYYKHFIRIKESSWTISTLPQAVSELRHVAVVVVKAQCTKIKNITFIVE